MNRVERAIIMAAGFGNRMKPVSLVTPKPLIKVNGKRMIDSVVEALHENEIYEIYVVVGYKKEQFYEWVKDYPDVTLIENPHYETCNNISSLYAARDHIENAIILDGDQIIYNKDILSREFTLSGYNGVWIENDTKEWLMQVENGIVTACSRVGGNTGWQLFSVSRWSKEDGILMKEFIEKEFESGNTDVYWDDIPMFLYFDRFKLGVHPMKLTDIVEIDDYEELVAIDSSYRNYEV